MNTTTQHINKIPLGNNIFMKEFFLQPGDAAPVPAERETPPQLMTEMDRLVKLYHAENFIEIDGRKIPAVHDGTYKLSEITMHTLEEPFEPSSRFKKAITARREKALGKLLSSGGHDGKNVSVRDWTISPDGVKLIGQPMYYTQFRSTDAVQDELLNPYDDSFSETATLRDYVLVNGKESRKGTDVLSNLLGAAFLVRANGRDGQEYFVLGRRKGGRINEGGALSVIGGTPMWEPQFFGERKADFAGYMKKLGAEEHHEELRLHPGEIEVGNDVYFVRTLVRVFDPFYAVDVDPSITVEDIAARCFGDTSALEEHDRLYALPRTAEALNGLFNNNRGYGIGQGTLAGLHLALQEKK